MKAGGLKLKSNQTIFDIQMLDKHTRTFVDVKAWELIYGCC